MWPEWEGGASTNLFDHLPAQRLGIEWDLCVVLYAVGWCALREAK